MADSIEYTPVQTRHGKTVHAIAMTSPRSACNKPWPKTGWVVTRKPITCRDCKLMIGRACRAARRAEVIAARKEAEAR